MLSKFLALRGLVNKGGGGGSSGGGSSVSKKDVNFYDYDGTLLHSYTVKEAQKLTELPPLPAQPGLICQGWNWSLEDIKAESGAVDAGAMYITDDGTTRIYITLNEGRTSPMLGVGVNGTVTVDWGDGTEPDVLTGTSISTVKQTPNHNYDAPGEYVIRLTVVDGEIAFSSPFNGAGESVILLWDSTSDTRNRAYVTAVRKVEIGTATRVLSGAFNGLNNLESVTIPIATNISGGYIFLSCKHLVHVNIPCSATSIGDSAFKYCSSLAHVSIPGSVTSIGSSAFVQCYSLAYVSIHSGVTSIGSSAFYECYCLTSISIPDGVTSIGGSAFYKCIGLTSISIPDGVTSIESSVFYSCSSLTSITIPNSVTSINSSAFNNCKVVAFYDFTQHTSVPTLSSTNAFTGIPTDCEIRVPAALYDEWIAATNWSTYASYIKAV